MMWPQIIMNAEAEAEYSDLYMFLHLSRFPFAYLLIFSLKIMGFNLLETF